MVTDQQVRRLFKLMQQEPTLATAADKAGMDEKTARKYRRLGKLPSEVRQPHTWRTRQDPFADVWPEIQAKLKLNPGLQAKTLFQDLQHRYGERFKEGQLRTLQRHIKQWRALEGPAKEVFFAQDYTPGERCQSDFTSMNKLGVTIEGEPFNHLIYHFVLPYSNWETGTICFSESFESLAVGLQNALFELGGVPHLHQTDSMSAAVRKIRGEPARKEAFTERYQALLRHYRMQAQHTQPKSPHENGDVEQRHHRFKLALQQALMMRGSVDFESRAGYGAFLDRLFVELNQPRRARFEEELAKLRRLPRRRLESCTRLRVKVSPGSTIRIHNNVYSVHSRLRGETVAVRLFADEVEVWYAQRLIERMPRLRGAGKHLVSYRHVIDWLVRKPGAFAHYRYRADLYPTHRFRLAYDLLVQQHQSERAATKVYLSLLYLAARENEAAVDAALRRLIDQAAAITEEAVQALLDVAPPDLVQAVRVAEVDLSHYDGLLSAHLSGDGSSGAIASAEERS